MHDSVCTRVYGSERQGEREGRVRDGGEESEGVLVRVQERPLFLDSVLGESGLNEFRRGREIDLKK